jgi:hypothetical protein
MPKNEIDYSNTIIYKIFCKDATKNDVYVGHTTNFIKRKYHHKICCNNLNNKLKIYNIMRENGGWDNWDMIEIASYNCKNSEEARIKEHMHYEELNATLNSVPPYIDKYKKYCNTCNLHCDTIKRYNLHLDTDSHKKKLELSLCKETEEDKNSPENPQKIYCNMCDYKCYKQSDYNKHILTLKHKKMTIGLQLDYTLSPKNFYPCSCGNQYKHRQGLWKHKKVCSNKIVSGFFAPEDKEDKEDKESELKALTNLVLDVVKQNQELTNKIVDICKTGQTNTITNSNFNSHNKTFNLNVFLNETCKDAMNIMDFVDSLKLQLSDLESVGKLGFVNGISNIIVKNLNSLDETKRPIHCTDTKRETIYIKDEDKWEKENDEKMKIRKVIKRVASKNLNLLPKFKEAHPDCSKASSIYSDQYNKIIVESCGGSGDNDKEKEDKIIHKIAKEVTINKTMELIK